VVLNESAAGRMILGGGWNESSYKFQDLDAQPALQRLPTYGFRLVKNLESQPAESYEEVLPLTRDYSKEKPVDDATFAILRGFYQYDPRPLNTKIERSEDTPHWRRETVTFDAAYGGERHHHIYVPKSASPPYQTVVLPGVTLEPALQSRPALTTDSSCGAGARCVSHYKGTYERSTDGGHQCPATWDRTGKDFGRAIEPTTAGGSDHDRRLLRRQQGVLRRLVTALEPRESQRAAGPAAQRRFSARDRSDHLPRTSAVPTLMVAEEAISARRGAGRRPACSVPEHSVTRCLTAAAPVSSRM
jgi:hypothetical protein